MTAGPRRSAGIYYGWFMVAVCMAALMLAVGTTVSSFGLYVLPVSSALGLSRAEMNTGMILLNAGAAVAALIVGRLVDRYSARLVMGASAYLLAASLIGLGLSRNIWLSAALVSFPVGFGMSGIGTLTAPTLVARWFTVHRSRALAITMMGMSVATVVFAPPIAWLIDSFGWRHSLIITGGTVAVTISLLLPFVRNRPGPEESEVRGAASSPIDATPSSEEQDAALKTRRILAMPRFWAIALAAALNVGVFQGILVSMVPIGEAAGFSTTRAATLISAMGLFGILGKIGIAWAGDRLDRVILLSVVYAANVGASFVLLFAHDYAALFTVCALAGFSAGAMMPLYLAIAADEFGARSFGSVNGNIMFLMAVVGAVAVRFSGEVYDRSGSYHVMALTFVAVSALSTLVMVMFRLRTGRSVPLAASAGTDALGTNPV